MKRVLGAIGLAALLAAESASAQLVATSEITQILSYEMYGGGDLLVKLATPRPECEGGAWLSKSDPGFEQNVSIILSARMSNRPITLYLDSNVIWPGSTTRFCRLYAIGL